VLGAHLGNTNYSFDTGYVNSDLFGKSPFALTKSSYGMQAALIVSASNGSVVLNDPVWALRFRANVVSSSALNPSSGFATNSGPGDVLYGAFGF
jgi:hypothetical protein